MSPLDTSTHDHDATAARADVVRGALKLMATETGNSRVMTACLSLAVNGCDAELAKLGRLIR